MHLDDDNTNEFYIEATKISDDFKLALADVVINFARLELAFDKLVWWAAHFPNVYVGRTITARLDVRIKCDTALALVKELEGDQPPSGLRGVATEVAELTQLRNAIVHGYWMQFGDFAVTMTPRGKRIEPGALMGGQEITIPDLTKAATRIREIQEVISKIVSEPAPSPRKHEH